jgi:hypothetical protein
VSLQSPSWAQGHSETARWSIPEDAGLPGLRGLFPEQGRPAFVDELAGASGADPWLERGGVEYVRYRPGRSCVALWSFPTPAGRPLHVYAKLVARGRAGAVVERPEFRALAASVEATRTPRSRPYLHLAERDLLLILFPFDPRLRGLPLALSAGWVREHVAPRLGLEGGGDLQPTPLSYKPERRCVVRYASGAGDARPRAFAKLFRDERGGEMLPWLGALAAQLHAAEAPWSVVPPLAHLPEARMLLLPAVAGGTSFGSSLAESVDGGAGEAALLAQVARAGRGLAAFQRCELQGLPVVTPRDQTEKLRDFVVPIRAVAPRLARSLDERLAGLERAIGRLAPEPLAPSHGAFRHGQLLLLPEALVVLDLDTLCRSGASADAGNFLAYLDFLALRRPRLRPLAERSQQAFVDALGPTRGWLAWYRAASLLKVALRSFLSLSRRWPAHTAGLLDCADRALAELDRPEGLAC